MPVMSFFATPEETEGWIAAEANRIGLVMYDEVLARAHGGVSFGRKKPSRCRLPRRE
jgi:hypothetical protein